MKVKRRIKTSVYIDGVWYDRVSSDEWYIGAFPAPAERLEPRYQKYLKAEGHLTDINGRIIEVGDLLMDAGSDRSDVRRKKLVKVEYVDKWNVVWKPIEGIDEKRNDSWIWRDILIVTREEWEKRQTQP